MIVATKYIEDCTSHAVSIYKTVSPLYTSRELNEMERSFLGVLKVSFVDGSKTRFINILYSLICMLILKKWIGLLMSTKILLNLNY
jgi:hypothetical protein